MDVEAFPITARPNKLSRSATQSKRWPLVASLAGATPLTSQASTFRHLRLPFEKDAANHKPQAAAIGGPFPRFLSDSKTRHPSLDKTDKAYLHLKVPRPCHRGPEGLFPRLARLAWR